MKTKRLHLALVISLLFTSLINSQNLVPNPSFETNSACPTGANWPVSNWYRVLNHLGSSDYMHACSTNAILVIPGPIGTQLPLDGNAYMGFFAYNQAAGYEVREYIQVQLNSQLVANQYYHVSFFISLSDFSYAAINSLGAALTNNAITGNNTAQHLSVIPQIITNNVLADKVNWVEISGNFQAAGGERYLTIGNFASDQQVTITNLNPAQPQWSYYFIDSVSVSTTLGVEEHYSSENIVFPNPFDDSINFKLPNDEEIAKIQIYSVIQFVKEFEGNNLSLELSNLSKGIYIAVVTVKDSEKKYIQKIIKN